MINEVLKHSRLRYLFKQNKSDSLLFKLLQIPCLMTDLTPNNIICLDNLPKQ